MMRTSSLVLAGIALIGTLLAPHARAIDFPLNIDHCTGLCLNNGGSGTVSVLQGGNSSTVNVTVTLSGGLVFQHNTSPSGNNNATVAFNLDLSSPAISISGLAAGW